MADNPCDLTLKQKLFVEAYLGAAKGNATEAARLAGYAGNDNVLQVTGSQNLSHPAIAARVSARVAAAGMTADEVLQHLAEIARADWRDFLEVKTSRGVVVEARILLGDKVRALELIGKFHGLFKEKLEVDFQTKTFRGFDPNDI